MKKKVLSFVEQYHMIEQNDHIVVGVSGGADSVCLLLLLEQLKSNFGLTITAVHVEHGIRGEESLSDAKFVQELCEKLDIPCRTYSCKAEHYAKEQGLSVEEAGRNLRYAYFAQTQKEAGANKIAVAHNQNDCAETMLFHLARGTGLRGLCGIAPVRGNIIRPILCLMREEIEAFLTSQGQAFCTDKTNLETDYTRNKIRHQVLPILETVNAQAVSHMNQTAQLVAEALKITDLLAEEARRKHIDGYFVKESLKEEYTTVQKIVLLNLLSEIAGSAKDLASLHVQYLLELFDKNVGKQIDLPYKIKAIRTYSGILVQKEEASYKAKRWERSLPIDESFDLPQFGYTISTKLIKKIPKNLKIEKKAYTKWFDYDKINGNVQIRNRRSGDYLVIDTLARRQKLKDYLMNEKVPRAVRDDILLLADDSHIIWAIGYRISEDYKITEHTKCILEVQVWRKKTI
ncbi:tRNA lysidine(34) synthetase TilS [Lachnospiraceae bacterium ZAX-1]